jgi:hypothetical protein
MKMTEIKKVRETVREKIQGCEHRNSCPVLLPLSQLEYLMGLQEGHNLRMMEAMKCGHPVQCAYPEEGGGCSMCDLRAENARLTIERDAARSEALAFTPGTRSAMRLATLEEALKNNARLREALEDARTSVLAVAMHSVQFEMASDASSLLTRIDAALADQPDQPTPAEPTPALAGVTEDEFRQAGFAPDKPTPAPTDSEMLDWLLDNLMPLMNEPGGVPTTRAAIAAAMREEEETDDR